VLWAWSALGRPARGLRLWSLAGLALVVFNVFYFSPGVSDTGPVYYFELLLPASLLVGHVMAQGLARYPAAATAALLVHLVLGTGSFAVEQTARLERLHDAINGRIDAVLPRIETPAILFYESFSDEKVAAGWVFSFPLRQRSERDAIVTYPRHGPQFVQAVRALWSGRTCYYFRVAPETRATELLTCDAAQALLDRPEDASKEGTGRMPAPTAVRLGLMPYIPVIHDPR